MIQSVHQSLPLPDEFPEDLRSRRALLLRELGYADDDYSGLAAAVMRLSDFYVNHPEKSSPWHEKWAQAAYLAYYLPLNWWRACGVIGRGQEVGFFDGFEHLVDFGSGLGSMGFGFRHHGIKSSSHSYIERAPQAIDLHRRLLGDSDTAVVWSSEPPRGGFKPSTLLTLSYSLTELERLPGWMLGADGLLIMEPSTKDDSRRLLSIRADLLSQGWNIWGPCTHSKPCPMLESGERDWCHDRFLWSQPDWLRRLEEHMPIKNGTLPCSWIMMRKDKNRDHSGNLGRVTGDRLEFKGFAKQMICRGDEREFMSWQRRDYGKKYPVIERGALVSIDSDIEKKGNELRVKPSGS